MTFLRHFLRQKINKSVIKHYMSLIIKRLYFDQ